MKLEFLGVLRFLSQYNVVVCCYTNIFEMKNDKLQKKVNMRMNVKMIRKSISQPTTMDAHLIKI